MQRGGTHPRRGDATRRSPGSDATVGLRAGIFATLLVVFVVIRLVKAALWPFGGHVPTTWWDHVLVVGSITWAAILPWALADFAGWAIYRRRRTDALPDDVRLDRPVCFRVVARGDQPSVVVETVHRIFTVMAERPRFPFLVEVVTDLPVPGLPGDRVVRMVVDPGYATPRGATHKARALQYALEHSEVDDRTWIVHLDEESHLTPGVVDGIADHIARHDAEEVPAVGQGLILYHRGLETNPLYTLADSIRVADDLGRFHLQYRLHRMLFGMHGSFVVVRTDVEKLVGWDLPPEACITEDTTWSLLQMEAGTRFAWVDGHLVEQSPQTALDFLRQRRRWFVGLWWGALHAPVRFRYRAALLVATAMWSIGWLALFYSVIRIFAGVLVPAPVAWLGDLVFAAYVTNYALGGWVSLADRAEPVARRVRYLAMQVLLVPWFAVLEAAAVVYAIVRPERGFHVVRKTLPTLRPVPTLAPTAARRAAAGLLRTQRPDLEPAVETEAAEDEAPPAVGDRAS